MKTDTNELGQIIKMTAMPGHGKVFKIFFARTNLPMTFKLGISIK